MDYIKIRFGNDLDKLSPRFEKTMEEMFRTLNPMFTLSEQSWKPQMDIYETSEEIIIIAEVAGVNKDDLELEINSKAVKLFGKRISTIPIENARFRLAEIQYGSFERVLFLPGPIDTQKVSASYSNGLLQIRLCKTPVDETRKIQIEDG